MFSTPSAKPKRKINLRNSDTDQKQEKKNVSLKRKRQEEDFSDDKDEAVSLLRQTCARFKKIKEDHLASENLPSFISCYNHLMNHHTANTLTETEANTISSNISQILDQSQHIEIQEWRDTWEMVFLLVKNNYAPIADQLTQRLLTIAEMRKNKVGGCFLGYYQTMQATSKRQPDSKVIMSFLQESYTKFSDWTRLELTETRFYLTLANSFLEQADESDLRFITNLMFRAFHSGLEVKEESAPSPTKATLLNTLGQTRAIFVSTDSEDTNVSTIQWIDRIGSFIKKLPSSACEEPLLSDVMSTLIRSFTRWSSDLMQSTMEEHLLQISLSIAKFPSTMACCYIDLIHFYNNEQKEEEALVYIKRLNECCQAKSEIDERVVNALTILIDTLGENEEESKQIDDAVTQLMEFLTIDEKKETQLNFSPFLFNLNSDQHQEKPSNPIPTSRPSS